MYIILLIIAYSQNLPSIFIFNCVVDSPYIDRKKINYSNNTVKSRISIVNGNRRTKNIYVA